MQHPFLFVRVLFLVVVLVVQSSGYAPALRAQAPQVTVAPAAPLPTPASPEPSPTNPEATPTVPAEAPPPAALPTVAEPTVAFSNPKAIQLDFAAHQPFISSGEALTFTLSVINPTAAPLVGLTLTASLPADAPLVRSDEGLMLTADGQRIAWLVPTMEPGQLLTASFTCQVTDVSVGTLIASQVTVSGIEPPVLLSRTASAEVISPATDTVTVTPGQAVWLRSNDQRVALRLPATAFSSAARVQYVAAVETPAAPPGETLFSFALSATEAASGQPMALAAGARLFAQARAASSLFLYDDAAQSWQRIDLDYASGYYVANVDMLGVYAVTLDDSYGREIFPTVTGFTSDEWSGNSSVHIPLELPPGPGGLSLPLSLDYSSESVNGLRAGNGDIDEDQASHFYYQAGFAGWGWELGGLGVVRWDHHYLDDPRVMLSFPGGSFELVNKDSGWQTEPQSFYRIEHGAGYQYSDPWYVYTPDGIRYKFGTGGGGNGDTWLVAPNCYAGEARNLYLTEVRDAHGNRIEIQYATDLAKFRCSDGSVTYPRAIRPERINYYNHNTASGGASTTRIIFNYGGRDDIGIEGKGEYKQAYWGDYRLGYIDIRVRTKCNVDPTDPARQDDCFDTARSYWLDHTHSWWDEDDGEGLLLLAKLTEKNPQAEALPSWHFQYQNYGLGGDWLNHTLLHSAANGYGGSITYNYADTANIGIEKCGANTSRYRISGSDVSDGRGLITRTVYITNNTLARAWADGSFPTCQKHFIFEGFRHVTTRAIQVLDGAETLQRIVDTDYRQQIGTVPDPARGKLDLQIIRSPDGTELLRVDPEWSTSNERGANWVSKDSETRTVGAKAQKTTYQYDAGHQGSSTYGYAQYGLFNDD